MSAKVESIFAAAMELSVDDRIELADRLFYSVSPEGQAEIDRSWSDEVERRFQAYRKGQIQALDGEEILAVLKQGKRP